MLSDYVRPRTPGENVFSLRSLSSLPHFALNPRHEPSRSVAHLGQITESLAPRSQIAPPIHRYRGLLWLLSIIAMAPVMHLTIRDQDWIPPSRPFRSFQIPLTHRQRPHVTIRPGGRPSCLPPFLTARLHARWFRRFSRLDRSRTRPGGVVTARRPRFRSDGKQGRYSRFGYAHRTLLWFGSTRIDSVGLLVTYRTLFRFGWERMMSRRFDCTHWTFPWFGWKRIRFVGIWITFQAPFRFGWHRNCPGWFRSL